MAFIRKAVRKIFIYLLLTAGVYMFLESSSNSYNRMSENKITPASIVINGKKASVSVLDNEVSFSTEIFSPESSFYYMTYLLSPDDLKAISYGLMLVNDILLHETD
ncbi:MAG: hypothetical protein K2J39_05445 [Ruminococcus sp.]|nr:hypothetical protein [Ruminococcus sp.]